MKWDLLLPLHFPQVAPPISGVRGRLSSQGWQQACSYLKGGSASRGKQHHRFAREVTSSVMVIELSVRHTGFKCAKWFPPAPARLLQSRGDLCSSRAHLCGMESVALGPQPWGSSVQREQPREGPVGLQQLLWVLPSPGG